MAVDTKTKQPLVGALSEYLEGHLLNSPQDAKDALKNDEDWANGAYNEMYGLLEALTKAGTPNRVDGGTFEIELDGITYYVAVQTEEAYDHLIEMAALGEDVSASNDPVYDTLFEYVSESLHGGDEPTQEDFVAFCTTSKDMGGQEGDRYGEAQKWASEASREAWNEMAEMAVGEYNDTLATPADEEGK
jgi:hypothetical protein